MVEIIKPSHRLEIGGITQQTPWNCGLYDFGKANKKGTDYFNCGVIDRPDGRWLIARRAIFGLTDKLGMNDLVAFKLVNNIPQFGVPIKMGKRFPIEHFEDPRAMYWNGRTYISCCNFIRNLKGCTYPHQIICELDDHWNLVKRFDPVYGYNGDDCGTQKKHEKNWLWFLHDDLPHLLYHANNNEVVKCGSNFMPVETFRTEWDSAIWSYGEIRGGTPPVRVGDEYLTFFHSSSPWHGKKRQYHMGAYTFEAKAPFAIKKITIEPLLSGSKYDPFAESKPPCVFPCGALYDGNKWLVTLGVNDLACGFIEIDHLDLMDRMIDL